MIDPGEPSGAWLLRAWLTFCVGPLLVVVLIRITCVLLGEQW